MKEPLIFDIMKQIANAPKESTAPPQSALTAEERLDLLEAQLRTLVARASLTAPFKLRERAEDGAK